LDDDCGRCRTPAPGGLNFIPAYKLDNDPVYPKVAQDFERTFATLKLLPCDIFLSAHATTYHMADKYARMNGGEKNPFIDSSGYRAYVLDREDAFRRELQRQTAARRGP
jgi:metallo-beta-lactamase class B